MCRVAGIINEYAIKGLIAVAMRLATLLQKQQCKRRQQFGRVVVSK